MYLQLCFIRLWLNWSSEIKAESYLNPECCLWFSTYTISPESVLKLCPSTMFMSLVLLEAM